MNNNYGTFEQRLNNLRDEQLLSFNESMDLCERMILDFVLWSRGLTN